MKIVSYLFICLSILSFSSCSKDDDSNQEVTILGKWNVTEMTMTGNVTQEGMTVNFTGVTKGMAGNDITFKDNNTFTGNSAPFEIELNFIINGIPSTITRPSGEALPVSGEWSKEGNTLYLKETDAERVGYKIETLNGSTLKLTADQNSIDIGFPAGSQFEVTILLKR